MIKKLVILILFVLSIYLSFVLVQAHIRFTVDELDLNSNGIIGISEYIKSLDIVKIIDETGCVEMRDA